MKSLYGSVFRLSSGVVFRRSDIVPGFWISVHANALNDLWRQLHGHLSENGAASCELAPPVVDLHHDGDPTRLVYRLGCYVQEYVPPHADLDYLLAQDPRRSPYRPTVPVRFVTRCGVESKTFDWPASRPPERIQRRAQPREHIPFASEERLPFSLFEERIYELEGRNEFGTWIYRER